MNNKTNKAPALRCEAMVRRFPVSFDILKQALADDAFEGGEVACFDGYAVSWNTRENIVAIADSCGWWVMPSHTLKAIASATPNIADQRRSPE